MNKFLASVLLFCLSLFVAAHTQPVTSLCLKSQDPLLGTVSTADGTDRIQQRILTFEAKRVTSFDGTYKLDDAASDNIDNAIDQGVKGLNFLVRHFARSRVKKLNPAYRTVSIASSAREVSIVVDNQPALKMRTDGSAVVWTSPAGGKTNVKARFEGGHLLQEFDSPDGHRVNDYTLSTDGRILTMQVTETSSRLSAPIKYKQVYRRLT